MTITLNNRREFKAAKLIQAKYTGMKLNGVFESSNFNHSNSVDESIKTYSEEQNRIKGGNVLFFTVISVIIGFVSVLAYNHI